MTKLEVARLIPENQKQVQMFIDDIQHRSKLPGISVAMSVNGDMLETAAGVSDVDLNHSMCPDMHFELGCLNKFLIAIVALELFNNKFIDIEKNISYYLPELNGRHGNIIKVKHLLSHTAGYQGENLADPDIAQDYSWQKFSQTFNQRLMLYEPGTVFDYSHSAAVILGKIIEVVTQRKVQDLTRIHILEPLNIKIISDEYASSSDCVSGHIFNPEIAQLLKSIPAERCEFWSTSLGGPYITMRDLVKIGRAIVEGSSIFTSTTIELLLRQVIKLPGLFVGKVAEYPYFVFGLGCARFPNGSYGVRSNSCGQCCALRFDKENKLVIAVGINTNAANIRDLIIDKLFNAMLFADAPAIPELYPSPQTKLEMNELVGTYLGHENCNINISLENGQLALRIGHNPGITHDTKAILITWVKDNHGCIEPSHTAVPIPIGFFRNGISKRIGLMVGGNAFKKCEIDYRQ